MLSKYEHPTDFQKVYPQILACTPKCQSLGVHVPPNENVCGHADHFLSKPGFFQANYCDVTKVEVPNCVFTCNMRNEIVPVRVYQPVKDPATTDEFAADFSFMPE